MDLKPCPFCGGEAKMQKNEIIDILENEIACVKAGATCDRKCAKCKLVRDEVEIISALRYAISCIKEKED